MKLRRWFYVSSGLLITAMVIAFTPLADGKEGTWQNMVGDIVWTAIFVSAPLTLVLGCAVGLRSRRVSAR